MSQNSKQSRLKIENQKFNRLKREKLFQNSTNRMFFEWVKALV